MELLIDSAAYALSLLSRRTDSRAVSGPYVPVWHAVVDAVLPHSFGQSRENIFAGGSAGHQSPKVPCGRAGSNLGPLSRHHFTFGIIHIHPPLAMALVLTLTHSIWSRNSAGVEDMRGSAAAYWMIWIRISVGRLFQVVGDIVGC